MFSGLGWGGFFGERMRETWNVMREARRVERGARGYRRTYEGCLVGGWDYVLLRRGEGGDKKDQGSVLGIDE